MNSEELEQSLRTEFEIYLKSVFADMQQEIVQLQEKVQTEFDKHKQHLDGVFKEFSTSIGDDKGVDKVFSETVVEHLRLARDEGARITATAIAEAEDMDRDAPPKAGINELNNAVKEITEQTSQAAILKTLVNHAAQFTPRGAFFIIKNDHFVGWRVFGKESIADEQTVREVFFPLSTSTLLGEAVRSLSVVESSYGNYAGDSIYLNKLEFGHPDKMFAIPLVARGRGVAVLYADYGSEGESVNLEALETLVRIAGMTVELLASQGMKPSRDTSQSQEANDNQASNDNSQQESFNNYSFDKQPDENKAPELYSSAIKMPDTGSSFDSEKFSSAEQTGFQSTYETDSFSYQSPAKEENVSESFASDDNFSYEQPSRVDPVEETNSWSQKVEKPQTEEYSSWNNPEEVPAEKQDYSWNQPVETSDSFNSDFTEKTAVQDFSPPVFTSPAPEPELNTNPVAETDFPTPVSNEYQPVSDDYQKVSNDYQFKDDSSAFESSGFESTQDFSPVKEESYDSFKSELQSESSFTQPAQTVSETVPTPVVKSRFSDRNVDLPIEVSEEERRLHNDARRFARLLVSEIKLYNEQKVKEGRDENDLYERLREAIDRSREMYDKRVQPPVAAKFDYFHYELVNTLAESDEAKLGEVYPGAKI